MANKLGQLAKTFVVLFCLISWLEITNHCALASLAPASHEADHCCEKSAPATDSSICCQTLQTTAQASFAIPSQPVAALPEALLSFLDFIVPTAIEAPTIACRLVDPPGMRLASRLDSERCHPAFAPPFLS